MRKARRHEGTTPKRPPAFRALAYQRMSVRIFQDPKYVPFLYIQKCASSCLSGMFRFQGENIPLADYEGPLAVMWRNPKDRLESAYRMFRDRPEMGKTRDHAVPRADLMDFEPWAYQVLDKDPMKRDLHVASQTRCATDKNGIFKPTVIYKWDFKQIEADYGVTLTRRNESNRRIPTEWTPELLEAHRLAYAADWRVWEA
jgi:hypothetical protein